MNRIASAFPPWSLALLAGGVALFVAAAAFSGWLHHGSAIFLSLAESGLSSCF